MMALILVFAAVFFMSHMFFSHLFSSLYDDTLKETGAVFATNVSVFSEIYSLVCLRLYLAPGSTTWVFGICAGLALFVSYICTPRAT